MSILILFTIAMSTSFIVGQVNVALPPGCTGDPHDADSGPTGNPYDIIKSHHEFNACPGANNIHNQ